MDDTHALCTYYAWRGLGSHVRMACADARKKAGADPLLSYWDAFGMMLLGDTTEAAREFKVRVRARRQAAPCMAHRCAKALLFGLFGLWRHGHGSARACRAWRIIATRASPSRSPWRGF